MPHARVLTLLIVSNVLLAGDGATHADWPSYGGSYSAWRHSGLNQINTRNVKLRGREETTQTIC